MSVCALLTGRGNNTLKDKNILDILGKPVLYYPANAGAKSLFIDRCVGNNSTCCRSCASGIFKRNPACYVFISDFAP